VKRPSLLALIPLFFACDLERRAAAPQDRMDLQRQQYAASEIAVPDLSEPPAFQSVMAARDDSAALTSFKPGDVATNMVIRTAVASVKVDSLEPAIAALRQLAAHVAGFVANAAIQTGNGELRSATVEVKIPAARFDEAMTGLKPIGTLESSKVQVDDVGEEYVDVTARMDNARRLERRLIDLLATRTGKLKDVLDVEQSLAQVREEIERYEGRLRYLQRHTALSTLTVYIHEPVPVVGSAGTSVMGEAFRQAWRNFVTLLAVLVQSLGVILPLGAIAAAVWLVTRRFRPTPGAVTTVRASSRPEA
jgi:uncharacterized protein DUF4349